MPHVGEVMVGGTRPPERSRNSDNQPKPDYKNMRLNRVLIQEANDAHSVIAGASVSERDTIHEALRMFYEAKIDDAIQLQRRRLEQLEERRNG